MDKEEKKRIEKLMLYMCEHLIWVCAETVGESDDELVVNFASVITDLATRMRAAIQNNADLMISITYASSEPFNKERDDRLDDDLPLQ